MKKIVLFVFAACLSLAACVHPETSAGGLPPDRISIDEVEKTYADAKAFSELLLPYLSDRRVAEIRAIERKIEAAIAAARTARTVLEQIRALEQARAATAELEGG